MRKEIEIMIPNRDLLSENDFRNKTEDSKNSILGSKFLNIRGLEQRPQPLET